MFIFFIPVFDCSHTCKPYKSHLALFIISNKSFTRSFSASNDYFAHRTTISYRNAEALYLKLFEIQCFPAFSISSCWYYYFTIHIYYPPHPPGVAKNNRSKHCQCHDTGEIPHTFLSSVWSNFHREVSLTLSRFFFGYSSFYRRNALTFPAVFATICYG